MFCPRYQPLNNEQLLKHISPKRYILYHRGGWKEGTSYPKGVLYVNLFQFIFAIFSSYQARPKFGHFTIMLLVNFLITYIIRNDINLMFSILMRYTQRFNIFYFEDGNLWYHLIIWCFNMYQARPKFGHFSIGWLIIY